MSKLGTYKYIDDKKLIKKFEVTNILENSNSVLDDYYKSTLKDLSPEPATFAHEEKRKNTDSVGKLNLHYYGRRNDKEPFQNDLFLGFMDKDPRSIHNEPMMGKYQEQIWKRKDDFKYSFKDDSDNSIHSKGLSESAVLENKKKSYSGFKNRYKNFEESNDAWAPSVQLIKSKDSKVLLHDVDESEPVLHNIQDLQNRRDIINDISLNSLPAGWNAVPDQKYKIAQYTKLLSQANIKDINIMKNKNEQEKDDKQKILNNEQNLLKQLVIGIDNYQNKKKSDFSNQEINYKISKNNQTRQINKNKEFFKNNELLTTLTDDKKNKLVDALNNKIFSKKDYDILNNILRHSEMSNNNNYLSKGNNKENINNKVKDKNDILNVIFRQSIKSNNDNFINKGNNKEINNKSSNIQLVNSNNSEFIYNNSEINKNTLQKNNNNYEIINYTKLITQANNNYDSVKSSLENKLNNFNNEIHNQHRKPNNISNDALHADDFDTDADFTESGFKDRKMGLMGSKYTFNNKQYESSMGDTSINESSTLNMRSFKKNY